MACLHDGSRQMSHAWHFDAHLVADFLTRWAVDRGVNRVVDEVVEVKLNDRGFISSLFTKEGRKLEADLFIDCSGMRGLSDAIKEKVERYKAGLPLTTTSFDDSTYYETFDYEFKNFWLNGNYYCIFAGLGMLPDRSLPLLRLRPESNDKAEVMFARVQREFLPVRGVPPGWGFVEAAAAMRDIGFFLGSLKRHGHEPADVVPGLEPVLFELARMPEIAAADVDNGDFMHLHFAFETTTAVLRIVENFYDAQHAAPVHELPISAFELKLFDDWHRWPEVESLARAGAWFGAGIDFTVARYFGPFGMLAHALGLNMSQMNLHFDGYPGGCVMTVSLGGNFKYKLLQCVTPVSDGKNIMHMLISINKVGCALRRATDFVLFGLQTRQAARYDVKIWNGMKPDGGGVYSKYDKLVLKYRVFYRGWVDRVASER